MASIGIVIWGLGLYGDFLETQFSSIILDEATERIMQDPRGAELMVNGKLKVASFVVGEGVLRGVNPLPPLDYTFAVNTQKGTCLVTVFLNMMGGLERIHVNMPEFKESWIIDVP